jgi:hypothetical protein
MEWSTRGPSKTGGNNDGSNLRSFLWWVMATDVGVGGGAIGPVSTIVGGATDGVS